jgi:phenylalanyl-tRNA synthetase beta chain
MKVTYNWLKDFVEIKIAPKVLAEKLTMAGLEVTSLKAKESDFVFDIEITSNRPDCLSVIGIAREVAAITNSKLKLPQATGHRPQAKSLQRAACSLQPIYIEIEDKKDCPLYTAKIIKDVKVGPSPAWLRSRLELLGCRSVNNVVDITNYILFEWGQPLHAFDLDKLNSPDTIIVRRAKKYERITTLDGQQRVVDHEILVIADKKGPVALAGLMGGKDTEVNKTTKNVLLEAAIFNPIVLRHARQRLGIESESGYRFERGIDPEVLARASVEATRLISEIAKGNCVLAKSSTRLKKEKRLIRLDMPYVHKILGIDIKQNKIKEILNNLGFAVKIKTKNNFSVCLPSFRQDVSLAIDLIEEIARIYGYAQIPTSLPAMKPQITAIGRRDLVSIIKNILQGLGLNEVITYSLTDRELLELFDTGTGHSIVEISNPLSKEQEVLRNTLALSLGRCIAYNLNQKQDYISIFEIAKVFFQEKDKIREEWVLGIALGQGINKELLGPLHVKGILEALFQRLAIKDYRFKMAGNSKVEICLCNEQIGIMRPLPENVLDRLDIKNKDLWIAELWLERLLPYIKNLKKRFTSLPLYPAISRDISLILKEDILAEDVLAAIRERGAPLLKEARIIDYYKGKQIAPGSKGLTISCLYRCDTRTLTEAEIDPLQGDISSLLVNRFAAQIRA